MKSSAGIRISCSSTVTESLTELALECSFSSLYASWSAASVAAALCSSSPVSAACSSDAGVVVVVVG